jgi:hypothetical protein
MNAGRAQAMSNGKTIAVDFDGCLVEDKYPEIGEPIQATIDALKAEQEKGARVILWTCRTNSFLACAVDWCAKHGIQLAAINANLLEHIAKYGGNTRKVYADEYWDDRAVRMPRNPVPEVVTLANDFTVSIRANRLISQEQLAALIWISAKVQCDSISGCSTFCPYYERREVACPYMGHENESVECEIEALRSLWEGD